jgi:hypothetical protein
MRTRPELLCASRIQNIIVIDWNIHPQLDPASAIEQLKHPVVVGKKIARI